MQLPPVLSYIIITLFSSVQFRLPRRAMWYWTSLSHSSNMATRLERQAILNSSKWSLWSMHIYCNVGIQHNHLWANFRNRTITTTINLASITTSIKPCNFCSKPSTCTSTLRNFFLKELWLFVWHYFVLQPCPLFSKIEESTAQALKKQFAGKQRPEWKETDRTLSNCV